MGDDEEIHTEDEKKGWAKKLFSIQKRSSRSKRDKMDPKVLQAKSKSWHLSQSPFANNQNIDITVKKNDIKKQGYSNASFDDALSDSQSGIFGQTFDDLIKSHNNQLPTILLKIITTMEKYGGLQVVGIYRESGLGNSMRTIIDEINQNVELKIPTTEQHLHDLANVLKYFLRNIPESVICEPQSKELIAIMKSGYNNEATTECLSQLSLPHRTLLFVLFSHFVSIVENCESNKMDSFNIGVCFGPSLLPYQLNLDFIDLLRQNDLINMLIKNFQTVFVENKPYMDGILSMIPEEYRSKYLNNEKFK